MRITRPGTALLVSGALVSPASAQVASLSTSSDTIMAGPATVLIKEAHLPGDGLVIVRSVRDGRLARAPIGQARIPAGQSSELRIRLDRPAASGEGLVVFLHADLGRKGVYDGDPVVLSVDIPEHVVAASLR